MSTATPPNPEASPPHGTPADQALGNLLVQKGLLTPDQLQAAHAYGQRHQRDLRQSILEMNVVPPERLNALAFELLALLAGGGAASLAAAPLLPDRAKLHRDIRAELKERSENAGLPELVNLILERACEAQATDIHFDSHEAGLRVRYRIDGRLQDVLDLDGALGGSLISRLKVMSDLNIVERRHAQDGRITFTHQDHPRDLRLATCPTAQGEKVVVRVHEIMKETDGFESLGMTRSQTETMNALIAKPYGAILVAGPVGSGKTTTLYSSLRRVNDPMSNVMTIEDPIELRIPGVNQIQVDHRGDMGFGDGLRAMLRQDPDVIMIGEIRDDETARIGIRAALTGVLVFSSLHAADAAATIGNLYHFGIPGYQLSSSLLAVVSQRLVRKICPYCRTSLMADPKVLVALGLEPDEHRDLMLHHGQGCAACFHTGYLGRVGVYEIMEFGEALRDLVFQQIPKDVLRRFAIDMGMQTLKHSVVDKILDGTTTVEEAYRVVAI